MIVVRSKLLFISADTSRQKKAFVHSFSKTGRSFVFKKASTAPQIYPNINLLTALTLCSPKQRAHTPQVFYSASSLGVLCRFKPCRIIIYSARTRSGFTKLCQLMDQAPLIEPRPAAKASSGSRTFPDIFHTRQANRNFEHITQAWF